MSPWLRALAETAYAVVIGAGLVGLGLAVLLVVAIVWVVRRASRRGSRRPVPRRRIPVRDRTHRVPRTGSDTRG